MTYSIVALDASSGELGIAVQSRWPGVGSVVPWVEPGVGAVATQSFAEIAHGPNGVRLMREGRSAAEALAGVLAPDTEEAVRQVGIVDAAGRAAAHTGLRCVRFASHLIETGVSVQANMMERSTVPAAMLAAYLGTEGDLAGRLLAALWAAEREGGDVRGRQSAALVVAPGRTADGTAPAPWARRFDLRVEDHRRPLTELARLLDLARGYEALDAVERATAMGDDEASLAASLRTVEIAPDDDQLRAQHAIALAAAGRADAARAAFATALVAEPRWSEYVRRFAAAGHLPDAEVILARLGIA